MITVLHSKVEDLEGLPDGIDKVDVIISEWMGLLLVQEAVLDSVISARLAAPPLPPAPRTLAPRPCSHHHHTPLPPRATACPPLVPASTLPPR